MADDRFHGQGEIGFVVHYRRGFISDRHLRDRYELVRLKWDAINFQHQTITIKHTVIPVSYQGKQIIVAKDRAKNKSSYRTLPLVPVFLELLLRLLEVQQVNQALYKYTYSN
ncbi:hypothetical protein D3C75_1022110 [compost metagenome]